MQYLLIEAMEMELCPIDVYSTESKAHSAMLTRIASVLEMSIEEIEAIYKGGDPEDETYIFENHAQTEKHGTNFAWRIIPLESEAQITLHPF